MTDPRRLHTAFERLCADVLLPLFEGGTVRVGRPIAPSALDYFTVASPSDAERELALERALAQRHAEIAPPARPVRLVRGGMGLAVAVHDLLALTDPALDRLGARRAWPVVLRWVDALIDAVPPPETRGDVLGRHAVMGPARALRRRDVVVHHWAGAHRFEGRAVPPRVLALPRLRRVRTERAEHGVRAVLVQHDAEHGLGLAPRLDALVARSPLTRLLALDAGAFGGAALDVLGDPLLRQGVAFGLASRPESEVTPALTAALRRLEAADPPEEGLARARALAADVIALRGATQAGEEVA